MPRIHKTKLLKRFYTNTSGNFATILALMSVPLMLSIGAAVDYSHLTRIEYKMQEAADAAALASAKVAHELNDKELQQFAQEFFESNGGVAEVKRRTVLRARERKNDVTVVGVVNANLSFLKLAGPKFQRVRVISRASKSIMSNEVELAFVVDTTQSMSFGGNWTSTVSTFKEVIDQISDQTKNSKFHATLVPFADRINIGLTRKNWLKYNDDLDDWEGCVEPLEKSIKNYKFNLDFANKPTKSFVPTTPKYRGGVYDVKGDRDCPLPITGPTKKVDEITEAFSKLKPLKDATGRLDDGLMWGWRSVSGNWEGNWSAGKYPSKNKKQVAKAVAYFTDGNTNINKFEMEQKAGEFGNNNGSKTLFNHFNQVCSRMKDEGIAVFIFHVIGNTHAEPYFKKCAGENYFKIKNGNDFKESLMALTQIGVDDNLRLIR